MRIPLKAAKTLCVTTAALTLLTAVATASRAIDVEPGGTLELTTRALVLREPFGIVNITCEATLSGRINRSIGKTRGNEVGRLTSGIFAGCRGAETIVVLISEASPAIKRYESFEGTLPSITGVVVSIDRLAFRIDINRELRCLYSNRERSERAKARLSETGGGQRFNQATLREVSLPRAEGAGGCPESFTLAGTFTQRLTQTMRLRN